MLGSYFWNSSNAIAFPPLPLVLVLLYFSSVPLTEAALSFPNTLTQLGPTCRVKMAPLYWKIWGTDKSGVGTGCGGGGDNLASTATGSLRCLLIITRNVAGLCGVKSSWDTMGILHRLLFILKLHFTFISKIASICMQDFCWYWCLWTSS